MANYSIKLEFNCSPDELISKLKSAIVSGGGVFEGDITGGNFTITNSAANIEADYNIKGPAINITITKKPFWKTGGAIEAILIDYLNEPVVKTKAEKHWAGKDIMLLIIGALISFGTATITNYFNAKREDSKIETQRKLDFNERFSNDLNQRLFLSWELYKSKRDGDTSLSTKKANYTKSKEDWNERFAVYKALLIFYYGQPVFDEFQSKVYNPEITLGNLIDSNNWNDPKIFEEYHKCEAQNITFITMLYSYTR